MIVKNKQLRDRTLLVVADEDYIMYNILVKNNQVDDVSKTIQKMHDKFFNSEKLEEKYGNYIEYINTYLDKKDIIFVEYSMLNIF